MAAAAAWRRKQMAQRRMPFRHARHYQAYHGVIIVSEAAAESMKSVIIMAKISVSWHKRSASWQHQWRMARNKRGGISISWRRWQRGEKAASISAGSVSSVVWRSGENIRHGAHCVSKQRRGKQRAGYRWQHRQRQRQKHGVMAAISTASWHHGGRSVA